MRPPFDINKINPGVGEYGPRAGGFHYGVDWAARAGAYTGTPIYAALSGTVKRTMVASTAAANPNGNAVWIDHPAQQGQGQSRTVYMHMRDRPLVSAGQAISEGQLIGYVGNTGRSTGPHLHWGTMWRNGEATSWVNPRDFINAFSSTSGGGTTPPNKPKDKDMPVYITATSDGTYAKKGHTYVRDGGSWSGVTNLEGGIFAPLYAPVAGGIRFAGTDLDLMFAVDGLLEQIVVPATAPGWGPTKTPLIGLGARTGRVIFPGSPGKLGQWHYPEELAPAPPVSITDEQLSKLAQDIVDKLPASDKAPTVPEIVEGVKAVIPTVFKASE